MKLIANGISIILHPLFILMYGIIIYTLLNPYGIGPIHAQQTQLFLLKAFISSVLFPILISFLLIAIGFVKSVKMHSQKERIFPLIGTLLFYIWLYINVKNSAQLPLALEVFVLGSTLVIGVGFVINTVYKISFHSMAVGGMLVQTIYLVLGFSTKRYLDLFAYQFDVVVLIPFALFLCGLVMSARLYLRAHTLFQVILGFFLGSLLQGVSYLITF